MYIRGLKKDIFRLTLGLFIFLIVIIFLLINILHISSETSEEKEFKKEVKALIKDVRLNCNDMKIKGMYHIQTYKLDRGYINGMENTYPSIERGSVSVNDKCDISLLVFSENYMAYKHTSSILFVDKTNYNECKIDGELEIGKTMKCLSQEFYVIDYDDKNITLLSMYTIDPKYNVQDKNNSIKVHFDKENNRNSSNNTYCDNPLYGCNVYDYKDGIFSNGKVTGTVKEESSIKYYVDSYGYKMNLKGFKSVSLISIDDLKKIGCDLDKKTCTNTTYDFLYSTGYWTGSYYSGSSSLVYQVLSDGTISTNYALYDNYLGIRPVFRIESV